MKKVSINLQDTFLFSNYFDSCIGAGRMYLGLQKEYFEQLKLVQEKIGFKYIRSHGLFSDDMNIYHEYINELGDVDFECNFTYLDLVIDNFQKLNIKPILELGFMPSKLASGNQTIFHWKGNVTPPKSYKIWTQLVQKTLEHLIRRYGRKEVVTWPLEVWNEPNLAIFWQNNDMLEYFKLFHLTFLAIKELDINFMVGGPAICGVDDEKWLYEFLKFCREKNISPDFISRHLYISSPHEQLGHYSYSKLFNPQNGIDEIKTSRKIIDSFAEFNNMPIFLTEFNTSYRPDAPIHDTNKNAVYTTTLLSQLGDSCSCYSYWTFGDIFEELGVPFTPFHGGFGLVANGSIPKPTFWTFNFFKTLTGRCIYKTENMIFTEPLTENYCGVIWNLSSENETYTITLPNNQSCAYFYLVKIVDEESCNPLKIWNDMGQPSDLSSNQEEILREAAHPKIISDKINPSNQIQFTLSLNPYAIVSITLSPINNIANNTYNYEKAITG